jgi:hypothetical protein
MISARDCASGINLETFHLKSSKRVHQNGSREKKIASDISSSSAAMVLFQYQNQKFPILFNILNNKKNTISAKYL